VHDLRTNRRQILPIISLLPGCHIHKHSITI